MHAEAPEHALARTGAARRAGGLRERVGRAALWLLCVLTTALVVRAAETELSSFAVVSNEEGVLLTYAVNVELSRSVDDALGKAVPLFFIAEAEVFRERWYWRDARVAQAARVWRIVYQPLTSTYRVTFAGRSQNYNSREEALTSISRGAGWKVAEPGQIEEGSRHYLEFSYRLDTSLLPRPMQIGIGGQADWTLQVQRRTRIN